MLEAPLRHFVDLTDIIAMMGGLGIGLEFYYEIECVTHNFWSEFFEHRRSGQCDNFTFKLPEISNSTKNFCQWLPF